MTTLLLVYTSLLVSIGGKYFSFVWGLPPFVVALKILFSGLNGYERRKRD